MAVDDAITVTVHVAGEASAPAAPWSPLASLPLTGAELLPWLGLASVLVVCGLLLVVLSNLRMETNHG